MKPHTIHIDGERIVKVGDWDDVPEGSNLDDFGDDVVMAGLVDTHVHINEPGRTEWEGFSTATRAAAAGGVTTVVDMPLNSIPATTSVRALEEKAASLEGKCAVDVGLWGGAVPGNEGELVPLLRAGALGFKAFLVDSGVPEFPPLDKSDLARAMDVSRARARRSSCTPSSRAAQSRARPPDRRCRELLALPAVAPARGGDRGHRALAAGCARTHARTHIVHLSAAGGLDVLARARDEGLPLTAETTRTT